METKGTEESKKTETMTADAAETPVQAGEAAGNGKEQPAAETQEAELRCSVQMDAHVLYDYLLHHAYSGASGILGSCFGVAGLLMFARTHYPLYLVLGILLIIYLPVNLRYRAGVQMLSPVMKKPLEFAFSAAGYTVSQEGVTQSVSWEQCTKAVSTGKSIVIYTGKNNASIFPRQQLGGQLTELLAIIGKYMDPKKVKIRY
ncbi:MAG: YcxB family protein [Lachnospiraceae bacterium]|nr:YcxB family protein [Lachnospiraceae bacterium]